MSRNDQLIRQLRLLQILEASRFGLTIKELRERLVERMGLASLSVRTVRRDLEALQSAGYDVRTDKVGQRVVWFLGEYGERAHQMQVTPTELMALSLGRDLLYPLAGTMFWEGIESFWQRVQEGLPDSVRKHYVEYRRLLRVHGLTAKSYADKKGMLETIHRCIREHRVLQAEYQPVGKACQTRRIEPYGMVIYQTSFYVVGGDADLSERVRTRTKQWKLDRFQRVEALDEWFQVPSDFDLDQYLGVSLGPFSGADVEDYRIRVCSDRAPWVLEDPWHPEQLVEEQPDGSVVITIQAAHPMAVIPRVLALGSAAEILEPVAARRKMAEILTQARKLYV